MPNYDKLQDVLELLKKAQDAEHDNRIKVREVTHFLEKEDGQWEPEIINTMSNRPRYTFDKCNPIVDAIAGEMEKADFDIRVRPAGGDATKEVSKVYDGIIRNIEAMSNAVHVFSAAGRRMVGTGFDAWRVITDWVDEDSFDQDLMIKKIANSSDRVWFDTNAEMQDMSDAKWCFVLQALSKDAYDEKFPDGTGMSVGDDRQAEVYTFKPSQVVVGEFLYKKEYTKELALMSNGAVYEVNDEYESVKDELEQQGITELRTRRKKAHKVMTRKFDGSDWLEEEKETVFSYIPVIPTYGNFLVSENKVIYRGAIEKSMDAQRAYNYVQSREIEEVALAPRGKYWMTREQAAKDKRTLQTMNTNANPVQTYTFVEGQPLPWWQGGAQPNPGLQQTSINMANNITESSGIFSANQGDAPMQSGIAIELQQNKGDISTIKYFTSQEIAICHTAKILIDAIPKVYDTSRQIRILNEDGSFEMQTVNQEVYDQDSGKYVTLNDLRQGKYDVTCDVGPAFKNRQQETTKAITELANVDPSIIQTGADVLLNNISAPGIDVLAERTRMNMVQSGLIPQTQWTDEEMQMMQQLMASQSNEPDPVQTAILEQTQAQTADVMSKAQERADKTQLKAIELQLRESELNRKAENDMMKMVMDQQKQIVDALNVQADTLKKLKDAQGVDVITGPGVQAAYIEQAEIVREEQIDQ